MRLQKPLGPSWVILVYNKHLWSARIAEYARVYQITLE